MKRLGHFHLVYLAVSLFAALVMGCGGGSSSGGPSVGLDNMPAQDAVDAGDVSFDGEMPYQQRDISGNHAPVANTQDVTCVEDTPCNIVLTGTDEDGDTLSYVVTTLPSNGTLDGLDSDNKVLDPQKGVTYTPSKDYNGPDSFQFYAFDGKQKSATAVVNIQVKPQEDPPVAQDITDVLTDENKPVTFKLEATDPDGDALTYGVDGGPSHGTITMAPNNNADGTRDVTYTPESGFHGTDQFTYHANDGSVDSNIATVTIKVRYTNQPPVAQDRKGTNAVHTPEDTAVDIQLKAVDPDQGDTVTYTVVTKPKHGTLGPLHATGSSDVKDTITYTPDRDYNGTDQFQFKATDSKGADSNIATIEVVVDPVNDPPIAHDQTEETTQDMPLTITLGVLDVDGDTLTFQLKDVATDGPFHGKVTFAKDGSATATYVPDPYFPNGHVDGQDSFRYVACDPSDACAEAQVQIVVHPKNDAPLVADQTVDTKEDTPVDITLNAKDPDKDPITYTIPKDKGPAHGTAVLDADNPDIVHYTPEPNWPADKKMPFDTDQFTVRVCDNLNACSDAVITVQVKPVEDAPVANDQSDVSVDQGESTDIQLDASDPDNDDLTFTVVSKPAHGTVTIDNATGKATYTPDQDYPQGHKDGQDSFTYKVCDPDGECTQATVTITVKSKNLPPQLQDQTLETKEDTPVTLQLPATDPNGDTVTYSVVIGSGPTHGKVDFQADKLVYTPDKDWPVDKTLKYGEDQFTLQGCDGYTTDGSPGNGACTQAVITIHVTPVNDPPVVFPFGTTTTVNKSIVLQIQATDADNDTITFKFTAISVHGTLYKVDDQGNILTDQKINVGDTLDTNRFGFVPDNNYTTPAGQPDTLKIQGYDGTDYGQEATISITIKGGTNTAPTVQNVTAKTQEGTPVDIQLQGADADGDPLQYWITQYPDKTQGTLANVAANGLVNGDTVTFVPADGFTGTTTFEYQADDGIARSTSAVVTVTVVPVNHLPTAQAITATVDEDSTRDDAANKLTFKATDPDDDVSSLTYMIVSLPKDGTLYRSNGGSVLTEGDIVTDGIVVFVPNPDWPTGHDNETQAFQYAACDNHDPDQPCGAPADVTITVTPEEDEPVAQDQRGIETNEDTPSAPIVLSVSDADCDELTFKVTDASPTVGDNLAQVEFKQAGTDANGCPTYQAVYTPAPNWPTGHKDKEATFTYQVDDGHGGTASATVTVTVHAINDPPDAKDVTVKDPIDEDSTQPLTVDLSKSVSDPDGDDVTYSVDATSQNGGTASVDPTTGELTYSPPANWPCDRSAGPQVDDVTYHVDDGMGGVSTAHVYITVNPVEDVPQAEDESVLVLQESTNNIITLKGSDQDCNEKLTYYIVDGPQHGQLGNVDAGTGQVAGNVVSYTPTPGYKGTDTFTYKVSDGTKDSAVATVSITIKGVNHKPEVTSVTTTTKEDTAVTITLKGSDADNDPLTFKITAYPKHGELGTITRVDDTSATVVYTPEKDYNGDDTFAFVANDGIVDSDPGTVTVTVQPVNDPPVAQAINTQTKEDTPVDITLKATDVDDDASTLKYSIETQPAHGTAVLSNNVVKYTPNRDWPAGQQDQSDTFTYKVTDPHGASDTAKVTVTVIPQEDPPVANDQTVETDEEKPVTFALEASDPDNDQLTYTIQTGAQHGKVTFDQKGNATYTPDPNWPTGHSNQTDKFTYQVDDGRGGTDTATVTITVHPQEDEPVAKDQSTQTNEDTPVTITLDVSDADCDTLAFNVTSASPVVGSDSAQVEFKQSGTDANGCPVYQATYTPKPDWPKGHDNQDASFTYQVDDGHGGTATAKVTITVYAVEDPPVANDQTVKTDEEKPVTFALDASDADGDNLTYTRLSGPSHGTVTIDSDGQATYTPNPNWPTGHTDQTDSFTYQVDDGHDGTDTATVTITVHPVNDQPVAHDIHTYTPTNTQAQIDPQATDADGDNLTYEIVDQAQYGTCTGGDQITFTPPEDFRGLVVCTYKANDGQGESNSYSAVKTVTIAVGVRFVNPDATDGAGTGYTWDDAFLTIQDGIDAAQAYDDGNDQVWVKKGTYTADSTDSIVVMKAGISVYGAFNGTEHVFAERPILTSGTDDDQLSTLDGNNTAEHVVQTANDTVLDGFIIQNGHGSGSGAGVYSSASNATIANSRIRDNQAQNNGGGAFVAKGDCSFDHVVFDNNTAAGEGGAIAVENAASRVLLSTVRINNSSAATGGAIALDPAKGGTWNTVRFNSNTASGKGGALYVNNIKGELDIENAIFRSNRSHDDGGAIYAARLGDNVIIQNAVFWDNEASDSNGNGNGGAVAYESGNKLLTLVNASFASNTAGNTGGAIYCDDTNQTIEVMNSNLAHDSCGGSFCKVEINGYKSSGLNSGYCARVDYSVINDGSFHKYNAGTNVATSTDPGYTDYAKGDLTLAYCNSNGGTSSSDAAIDRGKGDAAPATDIMNHRRCDYPGVDNGGTSPFPDSGAYECACPMH